MASGQTTCSARLCVGCFTSYVSPHNSQSRVYETANGLWCSQIIWRVPIISWMSSQEVSIWLHRRARALMIMIEWTYAISLFVVLQMFVIMLQERFGPAFFLPKGVRLSRFAFFPVIACSRVDSSLSPFRLVRSRRTITTHPSLSRTQKHLSSPLETARFAWTRSSSTRLCASPASALTRRAKERSGWPRELKLHGGQARCLCRARRGRRTVLLRVIIYSCVPLFLELAF